MVIKTDKLLHFSVSALLVVAFQQLMSIVMPHTLAIVLSSFLTAFIGFGKELYDWKSKKGKAERTDFRADMIGVALGILLSI